MPRFALLASLERGTRQHHWGKGRSILLSILTAKARSGPQPRRENIILALAGWLRGWCFFQCPFSPRHTGGSQYSLHAPPKVDLGLFVLVLGLWRLAPLQQLQQTMTRGVGGRPASCSNWPPNEPDQFSFLLAHTHTTPLHTTTSKPAPNALKYAVASWGCSRVPVWHGG